MPPCITIVGLPFDEVAFTRAETWLQPCGLSTSKWRRKNIGELAPRTDVVCGSCGLLHGAASSRLAGSCSKCGSRSRGVRTINSTDPLLCFLQRRMAQQTQQYVCAGRQAGMVSVACMVPMHSWWLACGMPIPRVHIICQYVENMQGPCKQAMLSWTLPFCPVSPLLASLMGAAAIWV